MEQDLRRLGAAAVVEGERREIDNAIDADAANPTDRTRYNDGVQGVMRQAVTLGDLVKHGGVMSLIGTGRGAALRLCGCLVGNAPQVLGRPRLGRARR